MARAQAEEILGRVEAIPLKGLYLAHHLYPSPGLRDMGDLDLLIRRTRSVTRTRHCGASATSPEFDPERIDGGTLNAVEYWRDGSMPVHLHWHVSNASLPHFMYRIDVDEIWRTRAAASWRPTTCWSRSASTPSSTPSRSSSI
jgi:hypothetical protein